MYTIDWPRLAHDAWRVLTLAAGIYFVPYFVSRGWKKGSMDAQIQANKLIQTAFQNGQDAERMRRDKTGGGGEQK